MNLETQKTVEEHADEIIEATQATDDASATVIEFPDRISRVKTEAQDTPGDRVIQGFRDSEEARASREISSNRKPNRLKRILAGTAIVAAATWLLHPFESNNESMKNDSKNYTDLAYDEGDEALKSGDTVLISNIKLNPNNSARNSGSEAVLGDERVQDFMQTHPDESTAIESSANNLPEAKKYAIVERDIDGDGDGDAVAVPVNTR